MTEPVDENLVMVKSASPRSVVPFVEGKLADLVLPIRYASPLIT